MTEYSFRLDLDMARKKIAKGVVRYTDGTNQAGNVNSTVGKWLVLDGSDDL